MFRLQKAIYFGSPFLLKKLYAGIPYPVRIGRHFRRVRRMLIESAQWNEEQLRDYQGRQLRKLLKSAFEKVPFYRDWARREGAGADDFRAPEDVRRLPLVSKEMMRDNLDAFVREDRWRFFYSPDATGGTLGPHFEFLADDSAYRMEQAYIVHLWARFGYRIMAPRATLRSRPVVNPRTANCWEYNPIHNELNLSIYELTERTLPIYVAACAKFQPRFIHGYPSALVILARLLLSHEDQKARFPKLVAVLGASEGLLPGQRELIEGTFGCRLVTWYGQTERVILAGECEGSNLYHCTPQYGITELIDDQGRNITEPGVEGELVGTGFINRVMPFIRYRMRDYSSWVAGYCPHCRRPYPLLSGVRGRLHDYLIGRDGRHVPMMALVDAPEFASVERFQFYQDIPGRVELRLMIREGFGDGYVQRIRRVMEGKLGKAFELDLKLVNHIALSPRGKLNCIIQKLAQS